MIEKVRLRSDRIRELMAEKRLRQSDIAKVLFVHPQTVWQILKRGTCQLQDAKLIAVLLAVEPEEIIRPLDS